MTGQVSYRLVALLAALTAILVAVWLQMDLGSPDLSAMVDHATQAAAALCAGVACFYASRREPSGLGRAWTQALRRGWRLIGAAAIVWGVAKLAWTYHVQVLAQQPFSQADVGYLAAIPLLVTGMLAFPIAVGHPAARIRTLLDALLVAGSLLAVSWVTTIGPLFDPHRPGGRPASLSQQGIELAQPIFDILLATVALSLLARTRGRDPVPMTMLCLGLLALAVASSGYVHLMATGRYGTHQPVDVGRIVGWLLVLLAALRPMAAHVDRQNERQPLARITLPYALLALAIFTLITVKQLSASHELNRFLLIDSVVLAALVVARQLVTLIENRQLNRRLERMVEELSEREAQLERALQREQQAAERLRAADSMKDTFLRAVSHDLRNPLTAILGVALTLERTRLQLPREKAMELLSMLVDKARKLDRLLADLLDLNRLEQGVLEPNRSHTDVGRMVRHLVDEVDHLEGRPVYVDVPVLVADIDGPKVERILENLLINTTRHTPAGTPVWVRGLVRGRDLELVVEDAGPGVPPELAGSIFEPFRQGPNAVRKSSGVGIGLSLVARFAQLHGGQAWVDGRYGGGAAFHVLLPDAVVHNGHPATPPALPPARQPGRRRPVGAAEVAERSPARR